MSSVPARARRHPMTVVTEARKLHVGGWKPAEIVALFERRGVTVSLRSVIRWTDAKVAETDRQRELVRSRRKASARSGVLGLSIARHVTPEFKFARLRALSEAGLHQTALATVMRFDFGDELTRHQIDYALKHGRYPKKRTGMFR